MHFIHINSFILHQYPSIYDCCACCRNYLQKQENTMISRQVVLMLAILTVCSSFLIKEEGNGYDRVVSAKYASYAAVAFCPKNCVQSWSCGTTAKYPKLVNVTYIENSVSKAASYIGYDPATETMITSWRGSNNAQNWIEDFNFEMEPYLRCPECMVHVGFMSDYRLNQKRLLAAAEAIVKFYKVSKILCTGHSLGAALSLINGVEFAYKFPNIPVEVHNFGSPRIGNEKLAKHLMEKISVIYRVVHNKDIVPHLPPEGQYKHPATQIFFDKEMANYKECSTSGEDKTCSNQFFPNYDPNDHDLYFVYISQTKCC